jgi:hypothetical protein
VLRGGDLVTDLLRVVSLASIAVAGLLYSWSGVLVFVFVTAVLAVPRIAALPRPVDAAVGVTWLAAGWANAAGWYVSAPWVDIPIHATTPGATAGAVYLLLVRIDLVPPLQHRVVSRRALVLLTFAVGATIAVLWEFYEWLRYHGQGPPLVGYGDTILDLLMGCLGSLVVGFGLAVWATAGWGTRRLPIHAEQARTGSPAS